MPPPRNRTGAARSATHRPRPTSAPALAVLAAVLVAVAATWGVARYGGGTEGSDAPAEEAVVAADGGAPDAWAIALAGDRVWTVGGESRLLRAFSADRLTRLGPARRLGASGDVPAAMVHSGRSLWIALRRSGAGLVVEVDESLRVKRVLRTGQILPRRLAVLPTRIVVLGENRLAGIATGGEASWSRPLPSGIDVAPGYGSIWSLSQTGGGGSVVSRRDPRTGRVIGRRTASAAGTAIAVGLGAIWVANGCDDGVLRLPVGGGPGVCTRVGKGPDDVTVGAGAAWVADGPGRRVMQLDGGNGRAVRRWASPGRPASVVVGGGGIFAITRSGRTLRLGARATTPDASPRSVTRVLGRP